MLARWRARQLDLSTEHEARGRILTLVEFQDLPFQALVDFYSEEEKADGA